MSAEAGVSQLVGMGACIRVSDANGARRDATRCEDYIDSELTRIGAGKLCSVPWHKFPWHGVRKSET